MSGYATAPGLLGGWAIVAVVLLALLVGALVPPGYRQVVGLVVMEGLLVAWVLSLWRLL